MNKVTAKIEVMIPLGFLVYDLADETIYCHGCGKSEAFQTISLDHRNEHAGSREKFTEFVEKHAKCVLAEVEAKTEKARREKAAQPCRQDYFTEKNGRRSGPHECGKSEGHGGECGP